MELLELAPLVGSIPPMEYPDSDGEPLGDNDWQITLMFLLREGLRDLLRGQQVYITGNVFWYPIEGQPTVVTAPDLLVAFGRPPGDRRTYREWDEDHVTPQVVMEIAGPSNSRRVLADKLAWYDRFGVEEYWVLDVLRGAITWYRRVEPGGRLEQQRWTPDTVSPRLGIRFSIEEVEGIAGTEPRIVPRYVDGRPFSGYEAMADRMREAVARADDAQAEAAHAQAQAADARALAAASQARAAAAEAELAMLRAARTSDHPGG